MVTAIKQQYNLQLQKNHESSRNNIYIYPGRMGALS